MTSKQAEALRNAVNALVAACDRVNLNITKCNTRGLASYDQQELFWLRRFIIGTREQATKHIKTLDKTIDTIKQQEDHE